MKFEQLLQIYWSRGFLYGGKLKNFNITLNHLFDDSPGLAEKSKKKFIKRFELNDFCSNKEKSLNLLILNTRKVINMYLAQLSNINHNLKETIRYSLIRCYLIKTFKGRCHALGKPTRGQRTRSNAKTFYKCNRIVRFFIHQVKKHNYVEKKPENLNKKFMIKKLKKFKPKIKMVFTKEKKNLWF